MTTPNLRFIDVSDDFATMDDEAFPLGLDAAALGYRRMCNFMSMTWFRALSHYEFAMRVDDDVCVQRFAEDPFAKMRRDRLVYAYGLQTPERHEETLATMPAWLSDFAERQDIELPDAEALVSEIFFTNLFISRVDWWSTERVQRFLQAVADSGGVFAHRWGDAPIHTAALRLFAPPEKFTRFPVDYLHASTMNRVFSDGTETDGWNDGEMLRHPLVTEFVARQRRLSVDELMNATNATNVTAMSAMSDGPEYYVLLKWTAEQAEAELNEISVALQEVLAGLADVDPSKVTVTIGSLGPFDPFGSDNQGDAADLGSGPEITSVTVAVLFPTDSEAESARTLLENLGLGALREDLVRHGLPAAAVPSSLQVETYTLYSPPPPSPPPSPPQPAPPPSFPPAVPRSEYEPLAADKVGLDVDPGTFMAIAAAALVVVVVLALLALRLARHKRPLECGVVPHARLGSAMLHWGLAATRFRIAIVLAVASAFLLLTGFGLPRIEQDVGTASAWVPRGSRLEGQLKDWERLIDDSVTDRTSAYIVVSSDKEGENLLDDPLHWLDAMLRTVKRAYVDATVSVEPSSRESGSGESGSGEEVQLSWKDFCFSVNHPILTSKITVAGLDISPGTGDSWKPCINPSPLDAFKEQMWEFNGTDGTIVGTEKNASFSVIAGVASFACKLYPDTCGQINDPSKFPSMYNLSREELIERMLNASGSAGHWIRASSSPWGKLFGSYEAEKNALGETELRSVKSLVYTLYQDIPKEVVKHRKSIKELTPEEFRDANARWLLALEDVLKQIDADEDNFPGVSVVYYPSNAIDRMYEEVASAQASTIAIGYCVMLAFVIVSQLSFDRSTNLALLGLMGFVAILFANAAAYGLIALLGFKYNHTMLQALPFLALGLGVDDLFLILHAFKGTMREHRGVRAEVAVALTMMEAGSSVTITSLCNAAVFFVACLIPIPALQSLLVSAGLIVGFNWVCSMTLFPLLLSFWAALFEKAGMRPRTAHEVLAAADKADKAAKAEKAAAEKAAKEAAAKAKSEEAAAAKVAAPDKAAKEAAAKAKAEEAAAAKAAKAEKAAAKGEAAKAKAEEAAAAKAAKAEKAAADKTAKEAAAKEAAEAKAAEKAAKDAATKDAADVAAESWWTPAELIARFYRAFSESLPAKLAFLAVGLGLLVGLAALIPKVDVGYKESDLAKKGSYLARGINAMHEQVYSQHSSELVVYGTGVDYKLDQGQMLEVHRRLVDSEWSDFGKSERPSQTEMPWLKNMYEATDVCPHWNLYNDSVDPSWAFYEDFHLWRKPQVFLKPRSDALAFGGLFATLLNRVNQFPMSAPEGPDDYSDSNHILLSFDMIDMDMKKLQRTEDKIQMVKDFKKITRDSGINIYMHGWLFVQIEQFLNLDSYFWQAAGISMLVVFAVSLLLGMSWCSAALIAMFAVALCVEVYGSLYLFDISYQPLACSSLLMSIGIAVEFVAHPIAAFEFAAGNRRERLADAMRRTALPVLEGAVSSFLGFCFLAASDFLFVTKYFFLIFFSICLFGTINALVFVPAILGIAGADKETDDFRAEAAESVRLSGADAAPRKDDSDSPRKDDAGSPLQSAIV